jgi:exopolysaccharide production protein ExoQ
MPNALRLKSRWRSLAPRPPGSDPSARYGGTDRHDRLAHAVSFALLIGFLTFTFIGTTPFGVVDPAARASGSTLDRLVVVSMFLLAGVPLMAFRRRAMVLARGNAWLLLLLAVCIMSVFWADFPALALRRTALLIMLATIAFAIAVGLDRPERLVDATLIFLGLLVAFNIATPVLRPDFAITPQGVRGMFSSKNVAGIVAMMAVIAAYAEMLAQPRPRRLVLGAAAMLVGCVFLVMTQSKTSVGLTALVLLIGGPLFLCWRANLLLGLSASLAVLWSIGGFFLVVGMYGWSLGDVLDLVFGDPTFTGRTDIWSFALAEIERRPWLGAGYGAFWDVGVAADPLQRAPFGSWLREVEVGVINQAHSGYLDLALQLGVPATIFATLIVLRSLVVATTLASVAPLHSGTCRLALFAVFFYVTFLVHNGMEASLFNRGQLLCNISFLFIFLVQREAASLAGEHAPASWWRPFGVRMRNPPGRTRRRLQPRGCGVADG